MNYSVSLSSGALSDEHSCGRTERIWQSSSVVIDPRQEMGLDGRWSELSRLMTLCPEEMSWEFRGFWKDISWLSTVEARGCFCFFVFVFFFRIWSYHIFGSLPAEMNWDLKHHKMFRARCGGEGRFSIVWLA